MAANGSTTRISGRQGVHQHLEPGIRLCGAGVACPGHSDTVIQSEDLSDATFVEIRTSSGSVVMSGELRNHVDSLGNVEKDAALLGRAAERVIGEIEIEVPGRTPPIHARNSKLM